MEKRLADICETYVANRDELRRILNSYRKPMHLMSAAVLTACGKKPDEKRILEAEQILKDNEPVTSPIRGAIKSVTVTHMSLSDDSMQYYKDLKRTQDLIRVNTGGNDERYYLAAMLLSSWINNMQEILMLIDKTGLIHEGMGKSFGLFSDTTGYVTAAFAAAAHTSNVRAYIDEVHACTQRMSEFTGIGKVSDDLLMLLALVTDSVDAKCVKAERILRSLRDKGVVFTKDEEFGAIGLLASIDMKAEEIAAAIRDADEFLKENSGFDGSGNDAVMRHVYGAALVAMAYMEDFRFCGSSGYPEDDIDTLTRIVLLITQSAVRVQMQYVTEEDLNI